MACGELSRLETSVVSDAEPSSAKRLLKAEEKVIDDVAGHDLEVLLPIARFHFEVYQRYLNENAKGRALVENHSRTMIHDLAMLEIAAHAFPVNPSPALLEAAARHGWSYFRPSAAEGITAAVDGE